MARTSRWVWWLVRIAGAVAFVVIAYFAGRPTDPQKLAERIQRQMVAIRGLPLEYEVAVEVQSQEDFARYIQGELQRTPDRPHYEKVLRMLGLLAIDETFDRDAARKQLMTTGAEGYYDPYRGRMSLVKKTAAAPAGDVYAHELYHALQDQHFDIKAYLLERARDGSLNDDELLARKMVVEGEATYAALLWRVQKHLGRMPTHAELAPIARERDILSVEALTEMHDDPSIRKAMGVRRIPSEPQVVPTFMTQLQMGIYREGMLFIYAVHGKGWGAVEQLYKESPPASTEQVLHPRKWFARERPVQIQWPAFETHEAFDAWELLAQNVMGELQWRMVFKAQRLSSMLNSAPADWSGDRYAIFKRRNGDDLLLLMYTAWDSESAAKAFAHSYRTLLGEKYGASPPPTRVVEQGRRVVIVEGGEEASLDSFVTFAESAEEIAPPGS